jgi:hypothetical protein
MRKGGNRADYAPRRVKKLFPTAGGYWPWEGINIEWTEMGDNAMFMEYMHSKLPNIHALALEEKMREEERKANSFRYFSN